MGKLSTSSAVGRAREQQRSAPFALLVAFVLGMPGLPHAATGVSNDTVRIGGVMDLEGRSRGLGLGMKAGIEAAIRGERVAGRRVEFVTLDDSYTPSKTVESVNRLIDQGVFLMIGNVGTPTAKVALPILAEKKVPAVGFFTGAGILRPGVGDIVNFRASYVQETAAVIDSAIQAGVGPREIGAFVQNDAYGMGGVMGIKRALQALSGTSDVVSALDQILAEADDSPARNNTGPVGVYQRNTFVSRPGYESLKNWERAANTRCRVVVTVGTYNAIARFVAYSRYKGETWVVSAVSFTGADDFRRTLKELKIETGVLMTQVVPPLDSNLPIVRAARSALGDDFGYVTLEGYIVGKLWLHAMRDIKGEPTREAFLQAIRGKRFDLGGLELDFTNDNQGSDLVSLTYLMPDGYRAMNREAWQDLLK